MPSFEERARVQREQTRAALGLPPEDNDSPTPAETLRPATPDPEGAIEDMRLAHSYLQDWEKKSTDDVLSHAAKYLELARAKDPNAKLTVEEEGQPEPTTYSIDDLAGRTLFYQAQTYYDPNDRMSLERACDTLKKALAYKPHSIQYRSKLADVFLDLHDKESALAVAKEALALDPKNLDARKLHDRIEAAPVTHPPSPVSASTALLFAAVGVMIFGIIALANGQFSTAFGSLVLAAIFGGISRLFGRNETFKKAMEHQQNEAQRKKMR